MSTYAEHMAHAKTQKVPGTAKMFVAACCLKHASFRSPSPMIYAAYLDWIGAVWMKPLRKLAFLAELRAMGIYAKVGGSVVCKGVYLRPAAELIALGMNGPPGRYGACGFDGGHTRDAGTWYQPPGSVLAEMDVPADGA